MKALAACPGNPLVGDRTDQESLWERLRSLLLAIFPQLMFFVFVAGLAAVVRLLARASFAGFVQFAFDPNLLRIYTLPLLVIAAITAFVPIKGPQDYFGGVALVALVAVCLLCVIRSARHARLPVRPRHRAAAVRRLMLALGFGMPLTGMLCQGAGLRALSYARPVVRHALDPDIRDRSFVRSG